MTNFAVSPVVRTARWVALGYGYLYGVKRHEELLVIRAAERAREHEIARAYCDKRVVDQAEAMKLYAANSYLYGTFHEE